jgi:hypothetical protein
LGAQQAANGIGYGSRSKGKAELEEPVSGSHVESRAEERSMSAGPIVGFLLVLLTTGCAGVKHAPPQAGAPAGKASAVELEGRPIIAATTHSTSQSTAKTDSPSGNIVPSTVPKDQLGKKERAVVAPKKQPALPPLDLTSLENRLKETKAIGLFSKIALKNQVDDLLDQFREFYRGSVKTTLAELRQEYDLLLLKVLSLLQDSDQSLATAIGASREAIWGILADRQKFAAI